MNSKETVEYLRKRFPEWDPQVFNTPVETKSDGNMAGETNQYGVYILRFRSDRAIAVSEVMLDPGSTSLRSIGEALAEKIANKPKG